MTDERSFRAKALRFLGVGGLGFCVDAGLLLLLTGAGTSPYGARALSLACSITLTWILNRRFSFAVRAQASVLEYGRYVLVALTAAGVNYGIYALCIFYLSPLLAMVAGSAAAMALTFTGYDRWVFGTRKA